jgi:effector-binding domain-containing protein
MQVKTHPAMNVIYSSHKVTLATLHEKIGTVARDLYEEAALQHLLVTGPVYWFYYGMDGKPETVFTLEIAIPISGIPKTTDTLLFNELPAFKCLSVVHQGAWSGLKDVYATLIGKIQADQLVMNGICREAYLNIDFSRDECNLTEVQIGIL